MLQICLLHSAFQFSIARSKLSAFQFSRSFLLLLPPRAAPPACASASHLRLSPRIRHKKTTNFQLGFSGFSISPFLRFSHHDTLLRPRRRRTVARVSGFLDLWCLDFSPPPEVDSIEDIGEEMQGFSKGLEKVEREI
ncbi:hypothetical protein Droror1_Dr00012137, partial [Drosera rotundifolia]